MTASRRSPANFLLFITDQHRADFLGCYGHPVLRTPHIDSIAARGTRFDRFYVASPVCMPNRASLMTGRMPSVHGVRSNGIPLSMNSVTFVELLRDAGYRTALIGKSHLQNFTSWPPIVRRPPPREGYREPSGDLTQALRNDLGGPSYQQETPEYWNAKDAQVQTPFYGFDHVTLVRAHGDEPGGDYDRWLAERDPKAKALLGPENSLPHDYTVPQAYRTAIPEELYATSFIGDRAQAFLQDARCRRTVLPDGIVPRSAPSVQPARQVLGYVQARAVSGAGGIFAQRLDAAAAHSQRHRRAREPARPISPA